MAVEIDKGIPIPPRTFGRPAVYPFATMEVGDSFLYRGGMTTGCTAASVNGKRLGRKFVTRKTPDGIRIWRVE